MPVEDVTFRVWFWFYMPSKISGWNKLDIFKKIWIRLLDIYDDLIGINWTWQSIDSISIKSHLGGVMTVGNNPTDRSKLYKKTYFNR